MGKLPSPIRKANNEKGDKNAEKQMGIIFALPFSRKVWNT